MTEYSVLDGINRIDTIPEYVKSLGQTAVAITDHGNVSGSYRFFKACRKQNIKPIIGMEAYYCVGDRTAKEKDDMDEPYYHLVLLAQNNTGLHNLFQLSSRSYVEGMYHKPRIDDQLLAQYNEGIIATSACLGSRSSQLIMKGRKAEAEKLITHHAEIFKDRFFIEVQTHKGEQQDVNKVLVDITSRHHLPGVVTADCHYTEADDKKLHEIALCMQTQDKLSNPKRFSFGDIDVHVELEYQMEIMCRSLGIPPTFIRNTLGVANMIDDQSYFTDVMNRFPTFRDLPPDLPPWEALERVAKGELIKKFGGTPPQEYQDRIDRELRVIKQMGFYDYLLIVWELLNGVRDQGVLCGPGRGSAAGSLVAYALGITQLDPIKHDLLFERFLGAGRAATPLIFDHDLRKVLETNIRN